MTEPKPHQQYITKEITPNEWKLILRVRQVVAGVIIIEKDADMMKWSVGGFWEVPIAHSVSASLPIEIAVT